MPDAMNCLVSEAKKNKFSSLRTALSDEDVISVWENVSSFIEKQMSHQKGVNIPGLGIFTFTQKKLDVGNNKYILIQRPVFVLSEKFAQTHQVHSTKVHVTGQISVVQLNFAALSYESPFDRDTVESCVKEVLQALARSVGAGRNVEFSFQGIGRLQIRKSKVKMRFYKEFLNSMDGSGQLVNALRDRPGTVDSVMSADSRGPSRCGSSNTLILPRINQGCLATEDKGRSMPTIAEHEEVGGGETTRDDQPADESVPEPWRPDGDNPIDTVVLPAEGQDRKSCGVAGSRAGSRVAVPLAKACGVSFDDDMMPQGMLSPKGGRAGSVMSSRSGPTPMMLKRSLSPLDGTHSNPLTPLNTERQEIARVRSVDSTHSNPLTPLNTEREEIALGRSVDSLGLKKPEPMFKVPNPPPKERMDSACGHHDAGQELCYLCHQRDARNLPISFVEEKRSREMEEERLLAQYRQMKDTEAILNDQEKMLAKRHDSQKMAAFNLGVAEAVATNKRSRDTNYHPSYVFQKRPLTPPKFIKQQKYLGDLQDQVTMRAETHKKHRSDEDFLERLEQVELAEDLAMQRDQYLKEKAEQTEQYKRALSAQVRFKPLPMPARVPDGTEPVFGKNDLTAEKAAERRRMAHNLFREQYATVESRKRDTILRQLSDQKEAEAMISRSKQELREDRADRYERMFGNRRRLEQDWAAAATYKKARDGEERSRMRSPAQLIHEQCDKYKRCDQCKRKLHNCGETNVWKDTRYIPGSRIMV